MILYSYIYVFFNEAHELLENNHKYLSNQIFVNAAENSGWAFFFFSRWEKTGWEVNTSDCFFFFEAFILRAEFSWLGIPVDHAA